MPYRHLPTSPRSASFTSLCTTLACSAGSCYLGLFGRILLYQEIVLLAIVLRVPFSSDPGDGREGRLNHHTWGCPWGCQVTAHKYEQSELDPQVQSSATIEAALRETIAHPNEGSRARRASES